MDAASGHQIKVFTLLYICFTLLVIWTITCGWLLYIGACIGSLYRRLSVNIAHLSHCTPFLGVVRWLFLCAYNGVRKVVDWRSNGLWMARCLTLCFCLNLWLGLHLGLRLGLHFQSQHKTNCAVWGYIWGYTFCAYLWRYLYGHCSEYGLIRYILQNR